MAEFRETISPIAEVARPQGVVSPSVSSETAKGLATALEGTMEGYRKHKVGELVGEETELSKLPGVGELDPEGETRQSVAERLQTDQLDDLNKIKTAREQGLITASRARLLANKAVRSRASDFPGMETALRKAASDFFEPFGPGEALLEQTSSEALAAKAMEGLIKEGVKKGFISPVDPMNDQRGIAAYAGWQRKVSIANGEKTILDAQLQSGRVGVEAYTNTYFASELEPAITQVVTNFKELSEKDQKIVDPNKVIGDLRLVEESLVADLANKLYQIPGATRESVDKQTASLRARFEPFRAMAKEGSLLNFLKNKRETIEEAMKVNMAHRLPELFGLETAFPKLGEEIIKMGDRYNNMNLVQKERFLSTITSPVLREAFKATMEKGDHFIFGPAVKKALESNIAPADLFTKSYVDMLALNAGRGGDPSAPDDEKSANSKSIEYVLKNVESDLVNEWLTKEPAVVARIKRDEKKVKLIKNRVRSGSVAISRQMRQELSGEGEKGDFFPETLDEPKGFLQYKDGEFSIKYNQSYIERVAPDAGLALEGTDPEEELGRTLEGSTPSFIKDLNKTANLIEVFGPEMNINIDEWVEEQVGRFNEGLLLKQEQRLQEKQTDNSE